MKMFDKYCFASISIELVPTNNSYGSKAVAVGVMGGQKNANVKTSDDISNMNPSYYGVLKGNKTLKVPPTFYVSHMLATNATLFTVYTIATAADCRLIVHYHVVLDSPTPF